MDIIEESASFPGINGLPPPPHWIFFSQVFYGIYYVWLLFFFFFLPLSVIWMSRTIIFSSVFSFVYKHSHFKSAPSPNNLKILISCFECMFHNLLNKHFVPWNDFKSTHKSKAYAWICRHRLWLVLTVFLIFMFCKKSL